MDRSETIGKLALALSKLQGEVVDAAKDTKGHNYSYATLSGILDIARPLLLKNELAVSQLCDSDMSADASNVGVETVLMHSSGEFISSMMYMAVTASRGMSAAQGAGSVITYCRRYALAAILGITQVDVDAAVKDDSFKEAIAPAVLALYDNVVLMCKMKGVTGGEVREWCKTFNIEKLSEANGAQLNEFLVYLNARAVS